MNPEQFRTTTSGRVQRVGAGQAAYWAFLPNPLPPDLVFDRELVAGLSTADRAMGELAGLARNNPSVRLLQAPFLRREAVLSSRIEGTVATVADVYAYEAGQPGFPGGVRPPEGDVREVVNYVTALEYGVKRLATLPVSLRFMRELHERLMTGVRGGHATPGAVRTSQNWIGSPGAMLNDATYVPPPVPEMADALTALEQYVHSDDPTPPLVRIACIHYQFEAIHPFLDGNGRIGRLLVALLLVAWDLLPAPLVYPSVYLERRRSEYYDRLLRVSTTGDWQAWLLFFLQALTDAARDAVTKAKALEDLREQWVQLARTSGRSTLLEQVVDLSFSEPLLTARLVTERFAVSPPSAMAALQRLAGIGVLAESRGQGRGRLFVAQAVLEALQ